MKLVFGVMILMLSLAYNPWTGNFQDCVIMRINDKNITLWDIQKVVVLDLIFRDIAPDATIVRRELDEHWNSYRNFFIVKGELDRIQYDPGNKTAFKRTAEEKIKKLDKSMLAYLYMYSISTTDAASFLYEKFRMKSYYQNFLYQLIEVKDEEIKEYYNKNKDKFKGLPFESVKEQIYSLLLIKKKRKRLEDYLRRLLKTESVEVLSPSLKCSYGGVK